MGITGREEWAKEGRGREHAQRFFVLKNFVVCSTLLKIRRFVRIFRVFISFLPVPEVQVKLKLKNITIAEPISSSAFLGELLFIIIS